MKHHPSSLSEQDAPLARLVAAAVGEALDRRFKWMVITAATVGLLMSLAVSLPLIILENHATTSSARVRALHNCQLVTQIADILGAGDPALKHVAALAHIHVSGGFLSSDARLRRLEVFTQDQIQALRPGPLKRLLADPETRRLSRKSRDRDLATTRYWQHVLIPALTDVAHVDCSSG